jgi:methylenetetrahydrofolate--tRNA-(uracil-5-)-methyltransferase
VPFAVVQLRQDNKEGTAFNMVGFQTKMAYGEQTRVFRLIPGLEDADFLKLGSIHRNLYINTPKRLNKDFSSQKDPWLFFAGQITGVEGYFESTCMGLMVARLLDKKLRGEIANDGANAPAFYPPRATALGSLVAAITDETKIEHFQPTNINFGHMPQAEFTPEELAVFGRRRIDKTVKRERQVENARAAFKTWLASEGRSLKQNSFMDEGARLLKEATEKATAAAADAAAAKEDSAASAAATKE